MMKQFLKTEDNDAGESSCCNDDYCEIVFPEPGAARSEVTSPAPNIAVLREKMKELMEALDECLKGGMKDE